MESNVLLYTAFKISAAHTTKYSLHIDKNLMTTVYPVTQTFFQDTEKSNYRKYFWGLHMVGQFLKKEKFYY